ncbi:MAG: signal peptidase II [Fimbriimonadales bacterium]
MSFSSELPELMRPLFAVCVSLLIALDQLSKAYIRANFSLTEQKQIIPGVLEIFHTQNEGIAFGMLQGLGIWLAPVALIVAIAAGVSYHRQSPPTRLFSSALILLTAGAIGNFIDRIFLGGKVTDFINIYVIHVFNIADACITVGAILLIAHWLLEGKSERQAPPAKTPPGPTS